MRPICESFVKITPALRSTIARMLIEKYNLNQAEVAQKLGVSQPAVSQYLKNVRGMQSKMLRSSAVEEEVRKTCEKMIKENKTLYVEFCSLCKSLRSRRLVCAMCGPQTSRELCAVCDDAC